MADTDRGSEPKSDPHNGYPPLLKSARFAADYADNPPSGGLDTLNSRPGFPGFNFCRKNFSIWTSLDSTKESEGLMLVQLVVIATNQIIKFKNLMCVGNISEEETEEEIPGGGIPEPAETRCVSSKTKCWLFLKSLTKVLKTTF